jgi:hypothetical protein
MASFDRALSRVKADLSQLVPESAIVAACEAVGHRWRERLLGPVCTVHLLVLQVLHFNTALSHVRHLAGEAIKPSALCQARQRLPLAVLQTLLRTMCQAAGATGLFHGHRLWIVDGSSASLPDTPGLQSVFPQPARQRAGCGFPLMKLLGLFDAATGLLMEVVPMSLHAHEQSRVSQLHPLLRAGDVLLGDRGFCSFWHAAMLQWRHITCIFRMHQRQIVDFRRGRRTRGKGEKGRPTSRWIKRLGKRDQLVEWIKPKTRPTWMTAEQFDAIESTLLVRELRYHLRCDGQRTRCVTIATTLLDPQQYPADEIAWLYGVRWEVETHFRELKTTMRMRVLKCKSEGGVCKELLAFALAYNLVRLTMAHAARREGVDIGRVSFIDTLRWLTSATPGDSPPRLMLNPLRPNRNEPRAIKRRAKQYDLMTRPRAELRKRLEKQAVEA